MSTAPPRARRRSRGPAGGRSTGNAGRAAAPPAGSHSDESVPVAAVEVAEVDLPSFPELGVPDRLATALTKAGIERPTPIQAACLPPALAGRDVLARSRTGTGKTLAFVLPVVLRLAGTGRSEPRRPRALVIVPTRELAGQVAATFELLAPATSLSVVTVFGGVPQSKQERALDRGPDVVVACPGRLEDLVGQRRCRLDGVSIVVLDEADQLADLGFLPAVRRLLDRVPTGAQHLFFSATLDAQIDALVRGRLHDPVQCAVDPSTAANASVEHHLLVVDAAERLAVVSDLAAGFGPTLVFTRTKHGARKLAQKLSRSGIGAVALHGDLAQGARERNLEAFRSGDARVLVATDIAARGIHVDGVALVVHADPPAEHKAFTHRSGRTGRAEGSGVVLTVATTEQRADTETLLRKAGVEAERHAVRPGDAVIERLRGPVAPAVAVPAPPAPTPARTPGSNSTASQRPARSGGSPNGGGRNGGGRNGSGRGGSGRDGSGGDGVGRGDGRNGGRRGNTARSGGRRVLSV